ncbi:hypothetical protein LCGC14_0312680 [marine sediment metagenome]|uniref:Phage Gp37/Gp68 family protein n=1 Tax=marine sediment metagenome TaxID=412755 RepID=A0A0F9W8K7_9ZZZZ
MGDRTGISWADATWSPIVGCSKISPGCAYCYAERLSTRFKWTTLPWIPKYEAENVVLHPERLEQPLRWKKPRRIFVNSMSDLFHELVPDGFIEQVFVVMALAPQHTFQVLTKRPERMQAFCAAHPWFGKQVRIGRGERLLAEGTISHSVLPNVWLGVSVENQYWAGHRIPLLLDTPAAVRFISAEPLLSALDLRPYLDDLQDSQRATLDLVIVGGESGGPEKRRLVQWACPGNLWPDGYAWYPKPRALEWVRSLVVQCESADIPLHFKGWGGPTSRSGGHLIDGREYRSFPKP